MMHGSASAPTLAAPRELQGYAHSERVARKVPPLALVPLDQLQQLQQRREKEAKDDEVQQKQGRRRRQRRANDSDAEDEEREELQQRLGERFLGMMALLARLRRMDLDEASSPKDRRQSARRSPLRSSRSATSATPVVASPPIEEPKTSAYELLVQKKKAQRSKGAAVAVAADSMSGSMIQLSPHRKPEPVVNVATAPLREHLTFEISMLLPQPIDARQSALESPIRRKKRRRRLRRKKRRLGATIVDGRRTWSTSHATWVPHASADYAKARSQEAVAAQASSKLVAKFAALKHSVSVPALRGRTGEEQQQRTYLYANQGEGPRRDLRESRKVERGRPTEEEDRAPTGGREEEEGEEEEEEGSGQGDDSGDDGEDDAGGEEDSEEEGEDDDDDDEKEDALPDLLHPLASAPLAAPSRRPPIRQPASVSAIRPMQTHQAAWISPELRRWLIGSGLFRTSTPTPRSKPTPC